ALYTVDQPAQVGVVAVRAVIARKYQPRNHRQNAYRFSEGLHGQLAHLMSRRRQTRDYYTWARAAAPQSTLSSPSAAGTTSRRARAQAVIWRFNSARKGTNSASPALAIPPPITIRPGFSSINAAFKPRAK